MSDNQVLALMTVLLRRRNGSVERAAREAVAIGELFGVHANEKTQMELLLGGDAFETPPGFTREQWERHRIDTSEESGGHGDGIAALAGANQ